MTRKRPATPLHPALIAIVKILAAVAVEEYLAEKDAAPLR